MVSAMCSCHDMQTRNEGTCRRHKQMRKPCLPKTMILWSLRFLAVVTTSRIFTQSWTISGAPKRFLVPTSRVLRRLMIANRQHHDAPFGCLSGNSTGECGFGLWPATEFTGNLPVGTTTVNGDRAIGAHTEQPMDHQYDGGEDILPTHPSDLACRVVTRSDAKLPTDRSLLPSALSRPPHLLRRLDDIYHAMAHVETRRLNYMNTKKRDDAAPSRRYSKREEMELVSVTRKSLEEAGFQLLSRRDLDLCEALNAGYLRRLSILPDGSKLDPGIAREFYPERFTPRGKPLGSDEHLFDGRVLVYWRGYSHEITQGRMVLPKLDYLQTSLVQRSAAWIKAQLDKLERWLVLNAIRVYRKARRFAVQFIIQLADLILNPKVANTLRSKLLRTSRLLTNALPALSKRSSNLYLWARYGGQKIRFVGSPDPTDALTPFMICEDGCCLTGQNTASTAQESSLNGCRTSVDQDMYESMNRNGLMCPYDSKVADRQGIPPMQLLQRVGVSNLVDYFSRQGRRELIKTLFARSQLVEPTYEEVVVVWRPLPCDEQEKPLFQPPKLVYELADMFDIQGLPDPAGEKPEVPPSPLQIRAFHGVPMANLLAVLPQTKLVFRPADAFVFDMISVLSFAAVIGSQRFDNPKLDLLAIISVSVWVIRTVFRYSNKLARYDLLVKNFLTSKITHRNAGALKYIATEAGSQRATRAALVYSWLLRTLQLSHDKSRHELLENGSREVNELINDFRHIPFDMEASLNDLKDLKLLNITKTGRIDVTRDPADVVDALASAWSRVFQGKSSWQKLIGRSQSSLTFTTEDDAAFEFASITSSLKYP